MGSDGAGTTVMSCFIILYIITVFVSVTPSRTHPDGHDCRDERRRVRKEDSTGSLRWSAGSGARRSVPPGVSVHHRARLVGGRGTAPDHVTPHCVWASVAQDGKAFLWGSFTELHSEEELHVVTELEFRLASALQESFCKYDGRLSLAFTWTVCTLWLYVK